jgi:hypothetical protein
MANSLKPRRIELRSWFAAAAGVVLDVAAFVHPTYLQDLHDIPPDDRRGWRVLGALGVIACAVGVAGVATDVHVLATHQLTLIHRISDIISLAPFGYAVYWGGTLVRAARTRLAGARRGV